MNHFIILLLLYLHILAAAKLTYQSICMHPDTLAYSEQRMEESKQKNINIFLSEKKSIMVQSSYLGAFKVLFQLEPVYFCLNFIFPNQIKIGTSIFCELDKI